jgi:hypothetical protein
MKAAQEIGSATFRRWCPATMAFALDRSRYGEDPSIDPKRDRRWPA